MSTELSRIQPGDLIKSDLINSIIEELQTLNGKLSGVGVTGSVTVPNLFGRTISETAAIIKQPHINLQFSNVLDAFGASVDLNVPENTIRIVIGQAPEAGARVNPGSLIDVLIAAKPAPATGGGETPPLSIKPIINSADAFKPAKVPIGEDLTIFGQNFSNDRPKNVVTFDGIPAGTPTIESTNTKLVVKVPVLPSPPAAGKEKEVTVVITTEAGGASNSAKVIVLPALAGAAPKITQILSSQNNAARIGEVITIKGEGFSPKAELNVVSFDAINAPLEATGNDITTLKVKVPIIPGVVKPDDLKDVNIFVTVEGRKSNVIGPFIIGPKA
jgi:hypothetical protein